MPAAGSQALLPSGLGTEPFLGLGTLVFTLLLACLLCSVEVFVVGC